MPSESSSWSLRSASLREEAHSSHLSWGSIEALRDNSERLLYQMNHSGTDLSSERRQWPFLKFSRVDFISLFNNFRNQVPRFGLSSLIIVKVSRF